MKIFNLFNKKQRPQTIQAEPVQHANIAPKDYSDRQHFKEGYKANVIVYSCVRSIALEVGKIPLILKKGDDIIESHPILELLNKPNPTTTGNDFIESLIICKLLTGNAYIQAKYQDTEDSLENIKKPPVFLKVLNPMSMTIKGNNDKVILYEYEYGNGKKIMFRCSLFGDSNILHLKEYNPTNSYYGQAPLFSCGIQTQVFNAISDFNYNYIKNNAKLDGFVNVNADLSNEQRQNLEKAFNDNFSGSKKAGKTLVTSGGELSYTPLGSTKEMDFINATKLNAQLIAQAFGVPYDLINTEQAKYDNLEKAKELLWDNQVKPQLEDLIRSLNNWLCPRYGEGLSLWYDETKVQAVQTKKDRYRQSLESTNFMTINEKRKAIGLDPYDSEMADQLFLEASKLPIEYLGNTLESQEIEKMSQHIGILPKK